MLLHWGCFALGSNFFYTPLGVRSPKCRHQWTNLSHVSCCIQTYQMVKTLWIILRYLLTSEHFNLFNLLQTTWCVCLSVCLLVCLLICLMIVAEWLIIMTGVCLTRTWFLIFLFAYSCACHCIFLCLSFIVIFMVLLLWYTFSLTKCIHCCILYCIVFFFVYYIWW